MTAEAQPTTDETLEKYLSATPEPGSLRAVLCGFHQMEGATAEVKAAITAILERTGPLDAEDHDLLNQLVHAYERYVLTMDATNPTVWWASLERHYADREQRPAQTT